MYKNKWGADQQHKMKIATDNRYWVTGCCGGARGAGG